MTEQNRTDSPSYLHCLALGGGELSRAECTAQLALHQPSRLVPVIPPANTQHKLSTSSATSQPSSGYQAPSNLVSFCSADDFHFI